RHERPRLAPARGARLDDEDERPERLATRGGERPGGEREREDPRDPAPGLFERPRRPTPRREPFEVLERGERRRVASRPRAEVERRDGDARGGEGAEERRE